MTKRTVTKKRRATKKAAKAVDKPRTPADDMLRDVNGQPYVARSKAIANVLNSTKIEIAELRAHIVDAIEIIPRPGKAGIGEDDLYTWCLDELIGALKCCTAVTVSAHMLAELAKERAS